MSGPEERPAEREQRELRECRSCYASGRVVEDARYDAITGELTQAVVDCPVCKGEGVRSVFVYPRRPA